MHSDRYTLFFAMTITIVASILLASAATLLKPFQARNEALDKKKNILISAGLLAGDQLNHITPALIEDTYKTSIREVVINLQGEIQDNVAVNTLDPKNSPDLLPLYINEKGGQMNGIIIPVSGKGLWSTIYGYIALEKDFNTVAGITFYKNGETPGLGAEIAKPAFSGQFRGKTIFENGALTGITIAKGHALNPDNHTVDGISGATLTGKGVNTFLLKDLNLYLPYITKNQEGM